MSDAIERVARAISESDARQRFELWLNSKFLALDGGLNEWTGQFEYVYPHIQSMWVAWQGAIEALRPEFDDAARYRWLRDADHGWYVGPEYSTYNDVVVDGEYVNHSAEGLGAAIDAARQEGK